MLTTPVLLIVFRRPEPTRRVFEAVARARPQTLLVVADGPRPDRPDDEAACAETRAIIDRVDWNCRVLTQFSDANLGCGQRPATGISWAFEHVDEAIILEDDCLPDSSFFPFAEEMLARYRTDDRVMYVSGSTFGRRLGDGDSYAFSPWGGCWGWATWKRAWAAHDIAVRDWPTLRRSRLLADVLLDPRAVQVWNGYFDEAFEAGGQVSFWDYQWALAVWRREGLAIVPRSNLVTNIGCGPDATHTLDAADPLGNMPVEPMVFPLRHPPDVRTNEAADRAFLREVIYPRTIPRSMDTRSGFYRRLSAVAPEIVRRAYRALRDRAAL